jgi:CBS domain containing-hemolysin-like protein
MAIFKFGQIMETLFWLVELVPDILWSLVLVFGLMLVLVAQLTKLLPSTVAFKIPLLIQYRLILTVVGLVLVLFTIWVMGIIANETKWQERMKAAEEQIKVQEQAAVELNAKLEQELQQNKELEQRKNRVIVKEIDRWNTKEVLKEVPGPERVRVEEVIKYIENCPVPKELLDIHNKAAKPSIEKLQDKK